MSNINTDSELERSWWGTFSVVIFLLGPALTIFAYIFYRPIGNLAEVLVFSGGLLLSLLFLLGIFVSKKLGWHSHPVRRLVNFGNIFGFIGLDASCVLLVNGALDPNPPEDHHVRVLNVPEEWNTTGRGFLVEDWREGHQGQELRLSNPPDGVQAGDSVIIELGPGLFSLWLSDVRPAPVP